MTGRHTRNQNTASFTFLFLRPFLCPYIPFPRDPGPAGHPQRDPDNKQALGSSTHSSGVITGAVTSLNNTRYTLQRRHSVRSQRGGLPDLPSR
ncbi:hypothetical protein E2C01_065778 [Portunus trituberculatus]|uniref:Uncharacterized protein n=1 Tax=Portunus trituberculatus TaxID=210409 RepID=A0A5B7HGH2_PORTR|nr:hypothetical protein [Portunus trituberculatus]